jgi:hypothetical protein
MTDADVWAIALTCIVLAIAVPLMVAAIYRR